MRKMHMKKRKKFMQNKKPLVAVFANDDVDIYNFRRELLQKIVDSGYDLLISCPYGEKLAMLGAIPFEYDNPVIDRRGTSIIADTKLFFHYIDVLRQYKPDIVLSYTIKPNVYAGLACQKLKIPYLSNITGLGTSIQNGGILAKVSLSLYKIGLKKSYCVFFQNETNARIMIEKKVIKDNYCLVPGSGVNLDIHRFEEYPENNGKTRFVTIGRIMTDKGIRELLQAAANIKKEYDNVEFDIIGAYDEDELKNVIEEYQSKGIINYLGVKSDVHPYIKDSNAIIHASYHEGMSNVLLESASAGRPVIATDVAGCIETYEPGITGIPFKSKDAEDLERAIREFINLPYEKKKAMGKLGREKMEKEFDRQIVVSKYLKVINQILEDKQDG